MLTFVQDFVLSVALTPDGSWVLSGSKDRGVQFWDPNTGVAQLMLQGHKNSGALRDLRHALPHLCSAASDSMNIRAMANHECVSAVISVAPSPQGNLFATGSGDMRARIWRLVQSPQ